MPVMPSSPIASHLPFLIYFWAEVWLQSNPHPGVSSLCPLCLQMDKEKLVTGPAQKQRNPGHEAGVLKTWAPDQQEAFRQLLAACVRWGGADPLWKLPDPSK